MSYLMLILRYHATIGGTVGDYQLALWSSVICIDRRGFAAFRMVVHDQRCLREGKRHTYALLAVCVSSCMLDISILYSVLNICLKLLH
jgi:hypothetical protein